MLRSKPNIAALITPDGVGGVAVIQIITDEDIAKILFSNFGLYKTKTKNNLYYGAIKTASAEVIDEVILRCGENNNGQYLEICCHGGIAIVNAIFDWLQEYGIERVTAENLFAYHQSFSQIQNKLFQEFLNAKTSLCSRIIYYQTNNVWSDFIDEVISSVAQKNMAIAKLEEVLQTHELYKKITEPPSIVIAGKPNSGKSTLFNYLVGRERVIVSPTPGTTRDIIKVLISIDGFPFYLYDTAGIRASSDKVEQMGIEKAKKALGEASIIVWLIDSSELSEEIEIPEKAIIVLNKTDISSETFAIYQQKYPTAISIVAKSGEGTSALAKALIGSEKYLVKEKPFAVVFNQELFAQINNAILCLKQAQADVAVKILTDIKSNLLCHDKYLH